MLMKLVPCGEDADLLRRLRQDHRGHRRACAQRRPADRAGFHRVEQLRAGRRDQLRLLVRDRQLQVRCAGQGEAGGTRRPLAASCWQAFGLANNAAVTRDIETRCARTSVTAHLCRRGSTRNRDDTPGKVRKLDSVGDLPGRQLNNERRYLLVAN